MQENELIYKKMYLALFHSTTLALEAMELQNFGKAKELLITGQQETEEIYIEAEE